MSQDEAVQTQAGSTGGNLASLPCREKYWEELDANGQIQKLREVVVRLSRKLMEAENVICQLLQHQHASNGDLVRPIRPRDDGPQGYRYDPARDLHIERERVR